MNTSKITVEDYSTQWPKAFEILKAKLMLLLGDLATDIQHVGSTSVPGLAAKPILDIDIIIKDKTLLSEVIARLATIGYEHCGDMGIKDRDAFKYNFESDIKHNLYVCPVSSISLKNHLALRDLLRSNSLLAKDYGDLKKELAIKYADNIDLYVEHKTAFIIAALKMCGFDNHDLENITVQNKA